MEFYIIITSIQSFYANISDATNIICAMKQFFANIIHCLFRTQILFLPLSWDRWTCFPEPKYMCFPWIYVQFILEWLQWLFPTSDFFIRFQHVSDLGFVLRSNFLNSVRLSLYHLKLFTSLNHRHTRISLRICCTASLWQSSFYLQQF